MLELASKSRSQVGEHPVELFRILDADGPGTQLANAFLKRGEGHGPSTMPQCATLFDTVHTLDRPKACSGYGNALQCRFRRISCPKPVESRPAGCPTVCRSCINYSFRAAEPFCRGGAGFVAIGFVVREAVLNACFRNPHRGVALPGRGRLPPYANWIIPDSNHPGVRASHVPSWDGESIVQRNNCLEEVAG
jgi:hypothetical protein